MIRLSARPDTSLSVPRHRGSQSPMTCPNMRRYPIESRERQGRPALAAPGRLRVFVKTSEKPILFCVNLSPDTVPGCNGAEKDGLAAKVGRRHRLAGDG